MTFPTGAEVVVVEVGTYTSQGGSNNYSGTITFTPKASRFHIATGTPMPDDPVQVNLTAGQVSVTLIASDASGFDIADVQYDVVYDITGPTGRRLSKAQEVVYLSKLVPIVDLDSLAPVSGATPVGVSVPNVAAVAGLTGFVAEQDLAAKLAPYLPSGGGSPGAGSGGAPAGGWAFGDMNTQVQTLLGYAQDAVRLGGDLTGTAATPQVRAGVVTLAKLATGLALPKSQLAADVQTALDKAVTAVQPGDVTDGGSTVPATSTVFGTVKLPGGAPGQLGGTAAVPVVTGWSSKLDATDPSVTNARVPLDHNHAGEDITSGTVSAARLGTGAATGRVLTATSSTTATWQVAAGGGSGGLLQTLKLSGPGPHVFNDDTWHDHIVEIDSSAPATVTLPTGQSAGAFAVIDQVGAGQVTFQAGTGSNLDPPTGVTTPATRGRGCHVTVRRREDPTGVTYPTAGLLARFRGSSLGSAGSAVASWADSSGVGSQALVQATTASQPTVTTVSGYKAATFDGTDDWLQMTGTLLDLARNRSTLVMYALALYPTAVAGKRTLASLSVNGGTSGRVFLQKETDSSLVVGGRRLDADVTNGVARGGVIPVATPFLLVGRLQWAANQATLYLNGAPPAATATFSNPNTAWLTGSTANTSNTASTTGAVGANTTGAAEFWWGSIFDVGFFSSDVDRVALDSALMNQYPGLFTASDYAGSPDRWAFMGDLG